MKRLTAIFLLTFSFVTISAVTTAAQGMEDYFADKPTVSRQGEVQPGSNTLQNGVAPANDSFAAASTVTMGGNGAVIVTSNNIGASKEANEPNHADNVGGSSGWFTFTPTVTRAVEIRTVSNETDFDTTLAVYSGNQLQFLNAVVSNDDCYRVECLTRSRVRALLQAGVTYHIAIDGYNNGTATAYGTFKLILEEKIVPFEFDNIQTAYDLGLINKVSIGATNHMATVQAGEPGHSGSGGAAGKSVWYRFTVPSTRAMTVSVEEDFRSEMAVYQSFVENPTFADLDRLDHGADHVGFDATETSANFLAWPGRYYFVAVDWNNDIANDALTGNFQLRIFQTKLKYGMRFDAEDVFASVGVFRPANATWYCLNDDDPAYPIFKKFGIATDTPMPADYDGDAMTNYAVTRNQNGLKQWYILPQAGGGYYTFQWGLSTDKEVVGDFDRDGRADATVIRNQNGSLVWYVRQSSNSGLRNFVFGTAGDRPVLGDFDGDGATEVAVVRDTPNGMVWYILRSNGNQSYLQTTIVPFGVAGDLPAVEDYDGDGKSDIALYRPSNGTWYILRSGTGQLQVTPFGTAIDVPQPGDYDGDGKSELASFRPTTGVWYFWYSGSNQQKAVAWGQPGDIPIASMARFSLPESNE